MTRRPLLVVALVVLTLAAIIGEPGAAAQPPGGGFVRRDIYCLNETSPDLAAYRRAVQVMRQRSATNPNDPTGWSAQANIHGTSSPAAGMISNACEHSTLFFLSWHRMYLYYFERIARQASGNASFALPYWGYSPAGNRDLPAPFRLPADASNVLYVSQRLSSVNAGSPLVPAVVDAGLALAQSDYINFTFSIEGTPHGVVHEAVGGSDGWMSFFESAARDPIFWLHHANIDRLWETWLAAGGTHTNPTDQDWMTRAFDFYDETGARVTMTGAQIVNAAGQLRYTYAPCGSLPTSPTNLRVIKSPDEDEPSGGAGLRLIRGVRVQPPPQAPATLFESTGGDVKLGNSPVDVTLPATADGKQLVPSVVKRAPGQQLMLVLDDVRVERPVSAFYEIYANLQVNPQSASYTNPYYIGNLTFFGLTGSGGRSGSRRIPLAPVFARLASQKGWRNDEIRLTFVPRGYTAQDDAVKALAGRTQATIGRLSIRVEPAAGQPRIGGVL